MSEVTYAFAAPNSERILLWCRKVKPDTYFVINGEWHLLYKNGFYVVAVAHMTLDIKLVWEGRVPDHLSSDYLKAMYWIDSKAFPKTYFELSECTN